MILFQDNYMSLVFPNCSLQSLLQEVYIWPGEMVPTYNSSTQKVQARGSELQDEPQPYSKFKDNLDNIKSCLKRKKGRKRKKKH